MFHSRTNPLQPPSHELAALSATTILTTQNGGVMAVLFAVSAILTWLTVKAAAEDLIILTCVMMS